MSVTLTHKQVDPINFLYAEKGCLGIKTTDGLDYMTDKVETVAKILTNHGVPTSVATSSSMDFADEYGFEKWDGAQKIWNAALNMVGYTIDEVY